MSAESTQELAFLEQAAQAAAVNEELSQAVTDQQIVARQLERNLASAEKEMNSEIDDTCKKRRNEIADSFNRQIDEISAQAKKVRSQREKTKEKAVAARVEAETAGLVQENRSLKEQSSALFRQNGVPGFANTGLFYSLYLPHGIKEILIAVLAVVICIVVIPLLVYVLAGRPGLVWIILIYVIDIVVFGGLYLLIMNKVKVQHAVTISQGRSMRDQMLANQKQIRRITDMIVKDPNEEMYGLQEFDRQLQQLDEEKKDIADSREQALSQFDLVGKQEIIDQIREKHQAGIEDLTRQSSEANQELDDLKIQQREVQLKIAGDYEPKIGKEFMRSDKLNRLVEAYRTGGARNLAEAQELVRTGQIRALAVLDGQEEDVPQPHEIGGSRREDDEN